MARQRAHGSSQSSQTLVELVRESIRLRDALREQRGITYSSRSFMRAADQRLRSARLLAEDRNTAQDSVYLAGYAVEFSLKAMILDCYPSDSKRREALNDFGRGESGHDLIRLRRILRQRLPVPDEISKCLDELAPQWSTHMRYIGSILPASESMAFLERAGRVKAWVERSLR
jgi:HEPN domain-containing protein